MDERPNLETLAAPCAVARLPCLRACRGL